LSKKKKIDNNANNSEGPPRDQMSHACWITLFTKQRYAASLATVYIFYFKFYSKKINK